jgi:phosphopantetheine adenylyltransferase
MDHLNKSGVQEIAAFGGAPDELVPSAVARALAERTAS